MDHYILDMQIREFKLKLFMSDGQVFEDLFCELMSVFNSDFRKVKAFGRQGDEKNDGFVPIKGEYYQCYGPEDISKESTEKYAIKKLKEDFAKLLEKWNGRWEINSFSYVINDKYKGTPPSVLDELAALKNEYSEILFDILDSQGLEKIFISKLNKMQRRQIVGINPAEVILEMNISNVIQPINDLDILGWFKIINNNIEAKIIELTKLRIENWYYIENSHSIRDQYIEELIHLLSEQEEMENEFLEFLKERYTSMSYLWSKYFKDEKEIVSRLIYNMQLDEFVIFEVTGFDYQSVVDESITDIIKMFNEIVKINNDTFGLTSLNTIQQSFDKVNKVIGYNKNQKNQKLNEVVRSIAESKNCNSFTVFQNSKKGFELDLDIQKFFESCPCTILNGDRVIGNQIVEILISRFESITEDATKLFSPHVRTHHIIFLEEFLNNNDKLEIKKLQKRSNIAVYYFEECKN
ncbi:hypothetical protein [Rossellomorea marisflavi]|uniref:hypothetical protein n=1 Tax=Rossellomorea marisflavi TaxID=189381 RepID=UPI003D2ED63E